MVCVGLTSTELDDGLETPVPGVHAYTIFAIDSVSSIVLPPAQIDDSPVTLKSGTSTTLTITDPEAVHDPLVTVSE